MEVLLNKKDYQKRYRVAGVVVFSIAVLTLAMRIAVYYLSSLFSEWQDHNYELVMDAIFSVAVQVLILLVLPFLIYKFALRMKVREVLSFSSFRKTKPINYLLAVLIGILGIVVTIGISLSWQIFLMMFGYMPSSQATALPENFSMIFFLLGIVLTAVLPGICEEFAMRGGFLTGLRSAFPIVTVVTISAFAFGLFHQYIIQTLYTACFGALMAFIVIRTKSIFPAMIVHFVNNGLSVYLDYAEKYNWIGGSFFDKATEMLVGGQFLVLLLIYILVVGLFSMLVFFLARINPPNATKPIMQNGNECSQRGSVNSVILNQIGIDEFAVKKAPPLELDTKYPPRLMMMPNLPSNNTCMAERILFMNGRYYLYKNNFIYALREKARFTPTLRDNIFYIGAIVVTAASTLATLIWGYIV